MYGNLYILIELYVKVPILLAEQGVHCLAIDCPTSPEQVHQTLH